MFPRSARGDTQLTSGIEQRGIADRNTVNYISLGSKNNTVAFLPIYKISFIKKMFFLRESDIS
jgi:hypothetical protein